MKVEAIEGLACSLRENGQDMQEYEDDGDHLYIPSTGRKYVEARSGQNFAVHLHTRKYVLNSPDPADCINARISLDGKFAIGKILSINEHPLDYDVNVEGVGENRGGRYYMREFAFADLATDDGPVKNIKPENVVNLGEVKVECVWMRKAGAPKLLTENEAESKKFSSTGESIPEKCLKGRAISHSATLGAGKACGVQTTIQAEYPYGKQPFATFIFKYRSRRDLQITGIIPRTPTPTPLEDRDPDSLTAEEARELVRQMRAKEAEQIKIKREKRARSETIDGDGDDEDVTVSSENRRRKRHRSSQDSGVDVIDLTDD